MSSIDDQVRALLQGTSLSTIKPEDHKNLLMPLSIEKMEAIVAGDTLKIKRANFLINKLQLRGFTAKPKQMRNEDETIDSIVEDLVKNNRSISSVPSDSLNEVRERLKLKKKEYVAQSDYENSLRMESLLNQSTIITKNTNLTRKQEQKKSLFQSQLDQALSEKQETISYWENQKQSLDRQYERDQEALQQSYDQELAAISASFPKILPASYRKSSVFILQLREQQKFLVLSKRFEEAIEFQKQIESIENDEIEKQKAAFTKDFEALKAQKRIRFDHQKQCFETNWKRKFLKYETNKKIEIDNCDQVIENVRRKIERVDSFDQITRPTTSTSGNRTPKRNTFE